MVWEPKICCCGCSLKTGTLILGWLGLIGSILSVLSVLIAAASSLEICYAILRNMDQDYQACNKNAGAIGVIVAVVITALLATAIHVMLIWGVNQNKPKLMLPYLICQVIRVVFGGIAGVIFFIGCCIFNHLFLAFIVVFILGVLIFLEIYYLLVVRACYKQVKQHRMAMGDDNEIAFLEHQDIPSKMQDIPMEM